MFFPPRLGHVIDTVLLLYCLQLENEFAGGLTLIWVQIHVEVVMMSTLYNCLTF